ncbi:MAG TPA: histidine phosphatase family protein [Acidimicrobiales bacterium]|jgi:broad specificity phosphatase PhoE
MRLTLVAAARGTGPRTPWFPDDTAIAPMQSPDRVSSDRLSARDRAAPAYRGPERRVGGTAALLDVDAQCVDALRSWDAGSWTGREIDGVARIEPAAFRCWRVDASFAPPGGESLDGFLGRVSSWLEHIAAEDGRVLVVADSTAVTAAVVYALAAPAETFWHLDVSPLTTARLHASGGTWRLRWLRAPLETLDDRSNNEDR